MWGGMRLAAAVILGAGAWVGSASAGVKELSESFKAEAPAVVFFDFDKDNVDSEAAAILQQQADWLKANPEARILLDGHTDAVGSNAYNQNLGLRRARAVEQYLVSLGVADDRMDSVASRGEEELAVDTQSKERRNRRVTTRVVGVIVTSGLCLSYQTVELPADATARGLLDDLRARKEKSETIYNEQVALASSAPISAVAAHAKTHCGIAEGYADNGEIDEVHTKQCICYSGNLDFPDEL
jgi:hypothetical protein